VALPVSLVLDLVALELQDRETMVQEEFFFQVIIILVVVVAKALLQQRLMVVHQLALGQLGQVLHLLV
jgi:hypothetical protein